ncbi:hypothetical protein BIV57_15535 [Mangrovactinospora gilvigrisea]|uniref:Sugar ABC transporter substrate-binding protein n=1 Tax=Mangrovactinospora gilvigrisea TaxID=1428644 RepID=A0A1J7BCY4_9ACTN|nr:extracellular solute-binding protein [Mangrovactinospora gilvigrisea]OIV36567.1 hypothetical protein BIV57_15535 [Mangrovactinospora gilvigrisea]
MQNRRTFLRGSAAVAAAAGAAPLLSACGSGTGGGGAKDAANRTFRAPARTAAPRVAGAEPGNAPGVPTVMTAYPDQPFRSVANKPGKGGDVGIFQLVWGAPPSGKGNLWLEQLNQRLGVTLKQTLVPSDSFGDKTQTTVAAGSLPDLFYINNDVSMAPAVLRSVAQGAFTELSEFLGGDAVKEFPNLARLETYTWKNSSVQNGIYGVPRGTPLINKIRYYRSDWLKAAGMSEPRTLDELFAMLTGFTRASLPNHKGGSPYAMVDWCDDVFQSVFGVPNKWRESGGKLTHYIETDAFEACLAFQRKLWKAGAYHPNTPTLSVTQQGDLFNQGRVGLYGNGIMSVVSPQGSIDQLVKAFPKAGMAPLIPPGHSGGNPQIQQEPGFFGMFGIPSSVSRNGRNKARVKELLGILDYMAAPFGSEEYLFMEYGIEGKNYTMKGGQITPNATPPANVTMINYLDQPENATAYFPGEVERAREVQKVIEKATPISIANPTTGLYSGLAISKMPSLDQMATDAKIGMITGREPMSKLKELRANWKSQGGEQVRAEYERALAKTK